MRFIGKTLNDKGEFIDDLGEVVGNIDEAMEAPHSELLEQGQSLEVEDADELVDTAPLPSQLRRRRHHDNHDDDFVPDLSGIHDDGARVVNKEIPQNEAESSSLPRGRRTRRIAQDTDIKSDTPPDFRLEGDSDSSLTDPPDTSDTDDTDDTDDREGKNVGLDWDGLFRTYTRYEDLDRDGLVKEMDARDMPSMRLNLKKSVRISLVSRNDLFLMT